MEIHFMADSDITDFSSAIAEYESIWKEDGGKIITSWERIGKFPFRESFINAVVFLGRSQSHPLSLRATYSLEGKKATLVHELGHRLFTKRRKAVPADSLDEHKCLDLFLFDVWQEVYGSDFAKNAVIFESESFSPTYKEAWDWAMSLSTAQREEEKLKYFGPVNL